MPNTALTPASLEVERFIIMVKEITDQVTGMIYNFLDGTGGSNDIRSALQAIKVLHHYSHQAEEAFCPDDDIPIHPPTDWRDRNLVAYHEIIRDEALALAALNVRVTDDVATAHLEDLVDDDGHEYVEPTVCDHDHSHDHHSHGDD